MATTSAMETVKVQGTQLVDQLRRLIHEGNVRRIIIAHEGETVAEFPLTFGVIGAVLSPVLAAVGAIAALLNDCTIEVERMVEPERPEAAAEPPTTTMQPEAEELPELIV